MIKWVYLYCIVYIKEVLIHFYLIELDLYYLLIKLISTCRFYDMSYRHMEFLQDFLSLTIHNH